MNELLKDLIEFNKKLINFIKILELSSTTGNNMDTLTTMGNLKIIETLTNVINKNVETIKLVTEINKL